MNSCDSFVILASATEDKRVIVAKNSDREPNEANNLVYFPAKTYPKNTTLHCTYKAISQVEHTYAILLLKPYWIWGGEYGSNQHGVTIANEAVFSPYFEPKNSALLGMDLLRLGIERGKTAKEALGIIIELLEAHGQGGNCGVEHATYYNNSFIVADREEAFILETCGSFWIWKKVKENFGVISNVYTIQDDWDEISPALMNFAITKGFCSSSKDRFNFASKFCDFILTTGARSRQRRCQILQRLESHEKKSTVPLVMETLRLHEDCTGSTFAPNKGIFNQNVCMHYAGKIRRAQTTGSIISHLAKPIPGVPSDKIADIHWATGSSAPCISSFKPIIGIDSLPTDVLGTSERTYNAYSFWWLAEELHRLVLLNYKERSVMVRYHCDLLEKQYIEQLNRFNDSPMIGNPETDKLRYSITRKAFESSRKSTSELVQILSKKPITRRFSSLGTIWYFWNWKRLNSNSGVPINWRVWAVPYEVLGISFIVAFTFVIRRWKNKI